MVQRIMMLQHVLFIAVLLETLPYAKSVCSDQTATIIDFSNQGITEVNEALFQNCSPRATSINLSGNMITHLNESSFAYYDQASSTFRQQFYMLETLILDNNQINYINISTFVHTKRLQTLKLNNNLLTTLESGIFKHLGDTLVTLEVSNNKISSIGMSVFTKELRALRTVDLSANKLTSMEAWAYIPPILISFNLSNNQINTFTNRLKWVYDLNEPYHASVNLSYNNFTVWSDEWFRQYQTVNGDFVGDFVTYRLDLTNNPWVCDCQMHYMAGKIQDSFYKYAESELLHVKCINPPDLHDQFIMNVDLSKFICNVTVDCAHGCTCKNLSESKILDVDCKNNNLTELPEYLPNIPQRTIYLDVSNNSVWKIDSRPYMHNIERLSAQNNKIIYIDSETVKNMTKIERLNISNNRLQFLPNSIQTAQTVSFFNNPFRCDCNMTWMKGWLELKIIEYPDKDVSCTADNDNVYKIIEVTEGLLDCNYDTEIGLAVGFGILLIIVVSGIVWAKRCPYETKVLVFKFFRIHPSDKYKVDSEEDNKEYDLYVSFDDTNVHIRQWVLKKFKKRLEVKEEAPKYNIFIPVINLSPGEEKAAEIVKTMENSKRIVIILSDKYDENEWSVFECQQAEMLTPNDGRIIFIKYHPEADDMVLTEPWKSRVKDRKVLSIGEKSSEHRWFWDKLRYELPVK